MRSRILIIYGCLVLAACGQKKEPPRGLIPEEKMEAVLWDIMRADQFLNDYVLNRDTSVNKRKESIKLYQQIFALHKVSKEDFQKSFQYYSQDPLRFKAILDSAGARRNLPSVQPALDTTRADSGNIKRLD